MAASILSHAHFHSEEAAYAYIEARLWPHGPTCPHCGAVDRIYALEGVRGKPSKTEPEGKLRYGLKKCGHCREQFTVTIGTVMESSHVPMRVWLQAIYLMNASKKGISTRQLQRTFQCSMRTAWHLGHRVREAMALDIVGPTEPMGGAGKIVEADETYIGGREKNKHKWKRNKGNIGGTGKQIVFSLIERGGKVRSQHIADVTGSNLLNILSRHVDAKSSLMSDDAGQYRHMGKHFARHEAVNHGADEYVRGDAHTNTAEGYFSILKRGLNGIYHSVSEQHLVRYLAEFDFRYNHRDKLGVNDVERADKALLGVKGKRLTYRRTRAVATSQQSA